MENRKDVLLDIRNLEVEYKTEDGVVEAVNKIDLTVRKGETVGLVGETGAGKDDSCTFDFETDPGSSGRDRSGRNFLER